MSITTSRAPASRVADADRTLPTTKRRRSPRGLPLIVLGAVMALVLAFILRLGFASNIYLADELFNVMSGRRLALDPGSVIDNPFFIRGPERMMAIIVALGSAIFDTTPAEMRWTHSVLGLGYVLSALPAYALARGLGLTRWPAVLVAVLTIATPWALYGATVLNVTLAFPLATTLAWAVWRTATQPSVTSDALVLIVAALNALNRFGQAPYAAVAVLAVAYAVWLRRPGGEHVLTSLRRFPLRLVRTHPLLMGAVIVALVAVLVLGSRIGGAAYATSAEFRLPWAAIWERLGIWFAVLAQGTGFVPAIIGTAWALREVVRPRSVETGTFAVVALGLFVIFVYTSANTFSVIEDRYIAPLVALPMIAFGAALFRRDAWPLGTLIVGLVAAHVVVLYGMWDAAFPINYFVGPTRLFFTTVMVPRVDLLLPGGSEHVPTILMLALAAAAVVVALVFARSGRAMRRLPVLARHAPALAVVAALPVLVFGALAGNYILEKYRLAVLPDKTFERMAWIERAADGERTLLWNHPYRGTGGARIYPALLAQYHNGNACCDLFLADLPELVPPSGELPDPFGEPRYIARFGDYHPLAFESTVVARSTEYGPDEMRVERLDAGPRASLRVEGVGLDGIVPPGGSAALRPLPAALVEPRRCVDLQVGAAPDAKRPVPFRVSLGGRTVAGRARPGRPPRRILLPIRGDEPGTVSVPATAKAPLFLGEIAVTRCP